jgi:signal transduction histidine kinase
VTLLVVREAARAERLVQHSFHLEQLSRSLLDANVRLEDRAQQVDEANRAKSRFLANVSHELRTPLNAIVGYNSLALEEIYGPVPRALRTAHERIGAAAEHLLGLVDDVLDLSKIEVGRMVPVVEPLDVTALLDGVRTVVEPIADAKDVRLDVVIGRDVPLVATDPRHARQILLNLASNAIKFTEKGSVTLVARRSGDELYLIVEDTGIGIAEKDLERIFDEFEQVRPSGRGDSLQRGTGLGLAIARKLARLLGGDIIVESRIGAGSRFTVRLPLRVARVPTPLSSPVYQDAPPLVESNVKSRDAGDTDSAQETSSGEGATHSTSATSHASDAEPRS